MATGSTNVSIYLGFTNGTFRTAVNRYLTGTNTQSVAAGDFNGDGTNDLAAANFGDVSGADGTVSILIGNGNGTFRPPVHYAAGGRLRFVVTADFNGDGILDLAVRTLTGYTVNILLGVGDGTFGPVFGFGGMQDSSFDALALGDANRDGKPDLAVLNLADSVSVFFNNCMAAGGRPELLIRRSLPFVTLSWPLPFADFSLESTTNLSAPLWQSVSSPRATNAGNIEWMTLPDMQQRFFRLRR